MPDDIWVPMKSKASLISVIVFALIYTCILYNCSGLDIDNASPTDFVGDAFNRLPSGWIVYTVPNETRVGNGELVEARISRNITDELYKDLRSRGIPRLGKIEKIGTRMRPVLMAENDSSFQIKAKFPEVTADRPIIGNYTEWVWDIMPLIDGYQKLKLDVYASVDIPPYPSYYHPYPVFEKTIIVKVNPLYTAKSWLWANGTWLVGLLVTFYLGRRSKT
jgi:hypothetical protein